MLRSKLFVELFHTTNSASANRWFILGVICIAQFLVVLSFQSIAIALGEIQQSVGISQASLAWVVTANELAFGGLLLLTGRTTDLWGHRRSFAIGIALFTIASLLCGLAWTPLVLIIGRALQGAGAAVVTPAAMAILSTTFAESAARSRALGVWGVVGTVGGVFGSIVGGIVANYHWSWVFWLNVPLGVLALAATPFAIPKHKPLAARPRLDLIGALVGTGAIVMLVYSLSQAQRTGFNSLQTIALLAGALVLIGLFWMFERRVDEPLLPRAMFRHRLLAGANVVTLLHAATTNTPIFFFALYMQQVRGASPMLTGMAFIPANIGIIAGEVWSPWLVNRVGVRRTAVGGMVCVAAALVLLGGITSGGSYLIELLPGLFVLGLGLGITAVAVNVVGTAGVDDASHGLAWGVINTSARIGTALGLAILATVASTATAIFTNGANLSADALVFGFRWAFYIGAALAVVGAALAAFMLQTPSDQKDLQMVQ